MKINEKFSLLLLEEQFSCSLFPIILKIYLVFNLFLIGEELFYNVLLASAVQHESVIVIYIFPPEPFSPPLHFSRSSQNARLGSLCYIIASYQLYILHVIVYICKCYFLNSSFNIIFSKSGCYNY